MTDRKRARELATEYLQRGDPTGWFEALYQEAEQGANVIPWADRGPSPGLLEFWKKQPQESANKTAVVIGCGLGDDAEQLAQWGFATTAFDISATGIRTAKTRFPTTKVKYAAADLFQPPKEWDKAFDFVLEINTIQALPVPLRTRAIQCVASFVRPGGRLLAIVRGRAADEPEGELPWPLTRAEMEGFLGAGLAVLSFEEYFDSEDPPARRFRVLYTRP